MVNDDCLLDQLVLKVAEQVILDPSINTPNSSALNGTNNTVTQIDTPPVTLDLRINAPDSVSLLQWHLLNPCLRSNDHNCLTQSTMCVNHTFHRYAFTCPCRPGFRALSVTDHRDQCVDINECRFKPHKRPCQPPDIATCTNTVGGYTCDCPDKYRSTSTTKKGQSFIECIERYFSPY